MNDKFNYDIFQSWYPDLDRNLVGRLLGRVKSRHSGDGKEGFDNWVNRTTLAEIREEVERVVKEYEEKKNNAGNQ